MQGEVCPFFIKAANKGVEYMMVYRHEASMTFIQETRVHIPDLQSIFTFLLTVTMTNPNTNHTIVAKPCTDIK